MINNDVLLFSATNEETPHEQLLHYWASMQGFFPYKMLTLDLGITWTIKSQKWTTSIFSPKYPYIIKRKDNEN